ncbi:hypothetical protein Tco_1039065 [Tanacetum coccineum]
MSSYNHLGCSCCGGPFNGGNCPSCSSVGSGNEFVYDPNPYSYNETPNFFNQPPQHQYETYSCEFCGGNSHPGFDCQTGNTPVFDQGPCYNQDFGFNQPPHYSPSQPQTYSCELCGNDAHYGYDCPPQVPEELADYINTLNWNCLAFYEDDDKEYTIAITPVLPIEEPDNSLKSLLNRDTSINSSPKFNSLLEEFSGELAHIDLISPGINETDFDPEEEIRLVEKLLYDKLSPRPPEEFNSENSDVLISDFSESTMMIYKGNIPILVVLIAPDYEASPARGFVLRSLELQSLA